MLICFLVGSVLFFFSTSVFSQEYILLDRLLKRNVKNGEVQYARLKKDPLLEGYIKKLEVINPESIKNKKASLAFWINAYNVYTLKLIVDNYPLKSIKKLHTTLQTVWENWEFTIYKKKYTLDKIEHKIIRARYKDPRIHAALVCAAKSCPPLRAEAFTGRKLEQQLVSQMRRFLADERKNYFDVKKKTLYLSKIFFWFKKDFAKDNEGLIKALLPYFSKKIKKEINKRNFQNLKVVYLDYDWSLNVIK